jgi:Putative DNA-binding domain
VPLADTQRRFRAAVVGDASSEVVPLLVGGARPASRLAIHQRHYRSSLVGALLSRFQATQWLVGSAVLMDAARAFVERMPPRAPCIAEYGVELPAWLAAEPSVAHVPFLADFAELDWQLGRLAVEINHPPLAVGALAAMPPDALADSAVRLQPGLHYLHAMWPIDEMMQLFVADEPPGDEPMGPAEIWLEVRGARGAFQFTRLDAATFVFRDAVKLGETLASAATLALDVDAAFDAGLALGSLLAAGLPIALVPAGAGRG